MGIPLTPKMLRIQAFAYAEKYGLKHIFNRKTGRAGTGWLRLFLKRHPDLAKRKVQILNPARAQKLNKPIVEAHFEEIRKLYDELDLHDHPEKIFNMDEKGCRLTLHRQPTVIARKGERRVHLQAAEHGENVTVVGCANALGNAIPPMILFKGSRKKEEYDENLPTGTKVLMAPKGSMTTELFIRFIEHLAQNKPPGKCLLIFDGAKCHLDFRIAEKAERHDIVLYCLPSNTTHELQPLDKSCYKPFETYWDEEVLQFLQRTRAKNIRRQDFNIIVTNVWARSMTIANIMSGFRGTGLYPLNPYIIPETAFAPSILTQRAAENKENSPRSLPVRTLQQEAEVDNSDNDTFRGSSPIATFEELQNLIAETEHFPELPSTSELQFIGDFSPVRQTTPKRSCMKDQRFDGAIPGPSGLGKKKLVEYSDTDISSEDSSSDLILMNEYINRRLPTRRLRIYSSTDSEVDIDNISPQNVQIETEIEADDDVPLAQISKKSRFQTFLPTPEYGIVKSRPRKKALNYKGQRVTKDLFKRKEEKAVEEKKSIKGKKNKKTESDKKKEKHSKEKKGKQIEEKRCKVTKEKTNNNTKEDSSKKRVNKTKSTTDSWYCHACHGDRIADMRPCIQCHRWYHEECVGLTNKDKEAFLCPDCD